ncbi:hypothetical protein B0O99DRAFT_601097 [Bisporella sp. PMI_857]|nr:hypothetical protein B0O99DRAFT_601097 [Bisporella sp. PMI_857]
MALPSAESRALIIRSTLGTKGQHSSNDKTPRRHRGKQRFDTVDRTPADKRRSQMRQAQRNFRLRKENTILSLQHKVSSMKEAISQASEAFLGFQEKILASGILDQAPGLSQSLKPMDETITSLASLMRPEQDVTGNSTVAFPFYLETQASGAIPERLIEILGRERTRREDLGIKGQIYYSSEPPLPRHIPETPVYDALLERFLDAYNPVVPYFYSAPDLIRVAAALRTSSPILDMAFRSVCVVHYGQVVGDLGIIISGRTIYSKVLNALRNALLSPEEFRGPSEHVSGLGNICYIQYRSHWVATALICRSRTFLANVAWKTIPWSVKSFPKDLMQSLLDHVADIPALLERYDNITKDLKTGVLSPFEASDQQALLQTAVADVKRRLHQWEKEWVASYPSGQIREVPANTKDYLPNFRYRDSITREIITPTVFASSDPQLIRTRCIYYSALVILLGVDTRPDNITFPEKYHYACLICRSLEYYVREVPRNLLNGVGFFLRVAHDTFQNSDIELAWVEEAFKQVAEGKSIKALGSKLPEFSV